MTGINSLAQQTTQNYDGMTKRQEHATLGSLATLGFGAPIAAGFAEKASLKTDAKYLEYEARAAELEGQRQATLAMRDFAQSQARAVAAIGASGIGYDGSPVSGLYQNEDRAAAEQGLIKAGAKVQAAALRGQAKQLKRSAKVAPYMGLLKGINNAGSIFIGGLGK